MKKLYTGVAVFRAGLKNGAVTFALVFSRMASIMISIIPVSTTSVL